jgi:hypothetical protein
MAQLVGQAKPLAISRNARTGHDDWNRIIGPQRQGVTMGFGTQLGTHLGETDSVLFKDLRHILYVVRTQFQQHTGARNVFFPLVLDNGLMADAKFCAKSAHSDNSRISFFLLLSTNPEDSQRISSGDIFLLPSVFEAQC